jgi:dimethylargininase
MFKNAIVRKPCKNLINGISDASHGIPDYLLSLVQHCNYVEVLQSCGLNVQVLDEEDDFPDSVFIEDVCLCTPHCAVITNPGAHSRKGEILNMKDVLSNYYDNIYSIVFPGTLDAGDVMMVGAHFYIGLSERTNAEGAEQLINILKKYKLSGATVPLKKVLHLKTGVSYLENNIMLVSGEFVRAAQFDKFHKILVDEPELYAANSLWVNNRVLVPQHHPQTKEKISAAGFSVIDVDVSEFQKLDGGLSCLSLRF